VGVFSVVPEPAQARTRSSSSRTSDPQLSIERLSMTCRPPHLRLVSLYLTCNVRARGHRCLAAVLELLLRHKTRFGLLAHPQLLGITVPAPALSTRIFRLSSRPCDLERARALRSEARWNVGKIRIGQRSGARQIARAGFLCFAPVRARRLKNRVHRRTLSKCGCQGSSIEPWLRITREFCVGLSPALKNPR